MGQAKRRGGSYEPLATRYAEFFHGQSTNGDYYSGVGEGRARQKVTCALAIYNNGMPESRGMGGGDDSQKESLSLGGLQLVQRPPTPREIT